MSHTTQTTQDQTRDNLFTTCANCEKPIRLGEDHVAINRNIEAMGDFSITVSYSAELFSLCSKCGSLVSEDELRDHISSLIKSKQNKENK